LDNNQGLQVIIHKSVPLNKVLGFLNEKYDTVSSCDLQEDLTIGIDIGTIDSLTGKIVPTSVSDEEARDILKFFYGLVQKQEIRQGTFQLIPYEF
jgi:hypothetical protein